MSKSKSDLETPKSNFLNGYIILTKSMVGVGMFGVAKKLDDCGLIGGTAISLIAPIGMCFALHILGKLAVQYKDNVLRDGKKECNFYNVAHSIAPWSAFVLELSVIVNCFVAVIAFLGVSGGMIGSLKYSEKNQENEKNRLANYVRVGTGICLGGLCYLKKLDKTAAVTMIALGCIVYIVIIIGSISFSEIKWDQLGDLTKPSSANPYLKMPGALCSFIFAYCCAQNIFSIANDTPMLSVRKLDKMSIAACLTGFVIYFFVSFIPMAAFHKTKDEIDGTGNLNLLSGIVLNNLLSVVKDHNIRNGLVQVACVAAAFQVSVGFFLCMHPLRNSIISLINRGKDVADAAEKKLRYIITSILLVLTVGISLLNADLDLVLDTGGLLGANTMCFVLPSYLYCKSNNKSTTWYICAVVLVLSVILYFLGGYDIYQSWKEVV